jgi:drug/metabolite transporter (DMT)-like permease
MVDRTERATGTDRVDFGVILSWLLLGDAVTPWLVAGLVLVAAGIALVQRPA